VVPVARKLRTTNSTKTKVFSEEQQIQKRGHNLKELSWIHVIVTVTLRPKLTLVQRTPQSLKKHVFGLCPGDVGSYSSETKQDRKMAPRPKLFLSANYYKSKGHNHKNCVLGSSAD
jgi:hypothetical protein